MIRVVAFDADDTLWHNEDLFLETRERFTGLLVDYHSTGWIERHLYEMERRNLRMFGYGIKGFTLSMIETAIELTERRITAEQIQEIIGLGKAMLEAPIRLLDGAGDVLQTVRASYQTAIVTKGDLFDQETKLARSGLGDHVDTVEIVSEKTVETYRTILSRLGVAPAEFVMIGNSMRSDVVPVARLGGHAVYIPYETEWEHETVASDELEGVVFQTLDSLGEVPEMLQKLSAPVADLP